MSAMEDYFWEAESEDLNLISRTFMSKVKTEYKMASYVKRGRPQRGVCVCVWVCVCVSVLGPLQ